MRGPKEIKAAGKLTKGHTNQRRLIDHIQHDTPKDHNNRLDAHANHMPLTQCGMEKGPELFEQEGADAVSEELRQMHALKVIDPLEPGTATREMRPRALNHLMLPQ